VSTMGKLLAGPWPLPAAHLEGQTFASLSTEQQRATLAYAMHDLRRYLTDLPAGDLDALRGQVRDVRPLRVAELTAGERARLAAALLPVLQRRAGWAA
jgi:hypothetical protein